MSALVCPFDNCRVSFPTTTDLNNHIDSRHVEYSELLPLPDTVTSASTHTFNQSFETSSSHLPSPASPNISSFLSGFNLPDNPMSSIDLTDSLLLHITEQTRVEDITVLVLKDIALSEFRSNAAFDLARLRSLKELNLNQNYLLDVGPLAQLTSLEVLCLDHNQISQVASLTTLENLRSLSLCYNHLTHLYSFPLFPHLSDLKISNNQLKDFSDVVTALQKLPALTSLGIDGNPIMRQQKHARYKLLSFLHLQTMDEEEVTPFDYVIGRDVNYHPAATFPREALLATLLADICADSTAKEALARLKRKQGGSVDLRLRRLASEVLSRHPHS